MPTAEAALDFFRRNDGLGESPDGSNTNWITDWWGLHDAWCAMSVSRALIEAGFTADGDTMAMPGVRTTQSKGWQYVPALARCWVDAGLYGDEPRPGSLAVVVYPSSGSWVDPTWGMPGDHVCMVERDLGDGTVLTRDGNWGNRIAQVRRSRSMFHGFCYPPYDEEEDLLATLSDEEKALLLDAARQTTGRLPSVDDNTKNIGSVILHGLGNGNWEAGAERLVRAVEKIERLPE